VPTRREFLKTAGFGAICGAALRCRGYFSSGGGEPLNILLITADDMNYDTPGVYGGVVPNITPHIDRLAEQGMHFRNAHVNIAVCQPCRQSLMTGCYPHRNGAEGFEPIDTDVPTLGERLREAGYLNGILGKERHLQPEGKYCWDFIRREGELASGLGIGRDPALYHQYSKEFFQKARLEKKPFFLMANSHDPHRPFAGSDQEARQWGEDPPEYSRKILPEEARVPRFLPDLPEVRREVAEYMTSAHRCDETVGAVLAALKESGFEDNTLVMFISDNGMSFPFAKANCYLTSTKTPWIVRWPGKIKPGTVDERHFISGIDFMPTILEAVNLSNVPGMDGRSFLPLLRGKDQANRTQVFTEFHETFAKRRYPMRCVQNRRFGYIFNFWCDGETAMTMDSTSGRTWKAMVAAAGTSLEIRRRVDMFRYRVPEEFYDFARDPDALHNLIDDPEYQAEIEKMRDELMRWMIRTGDPAEKAFRNRDELNHLSEQS